jgi:hypothetical protein
MLMARQVIPIMYSCPGLLILSEKETCSSLLLHGSHEKLDAAVTGPVL